jgi:hypothetical protein
MIGRTPLLAAIVLAALCAAREPLLHARARASSQAGASQASHVLVIVGLGGDHENAERFHRWAVSIVDAARGRYGLPASNVVYLGEDPARDTARVTGRSTREAVTAAVTDMAARARPGDRVLVVLIGHGASATPGSARFNLPGPDLSAADFARLMNLFAAQTVTFVNTASASGGFVTALAAKDRTVMTATRSEAERNQTRFGEYFAEALSAADADLDKDGRVSMLEVFAFARRRVEESYERDGQLLTEHAMLDDDGDGRGTDAPGQAGGDGALARTQYLAGGDRPGVDVSSDPELKSLLGRRKALEDRLAALKAAKETLDASQYERDIEQIMIELARVGRAIREKQR